MTDNSTTATGTGDNEVTNNNNNVTITGPLHYCHPTDLQEQVLAFLPIPSAILSLFGSVAILYMICNCRKPPLSQGTRHRPEQGRARRKKLTPYLRLLLAMSVYDIISSLNWTVAAFLRPSETSLRYLSIGNKTTCDLVGFVNQISHSTMIYMGMLSFYFLLTARYGISNAFVAKYLEPWMHLISIGYPLAFAIAGEVVLGGYGEVTMGIGCWVVATPNCEEEFLCTARVLSWVSYAIPLIIVCLALIVNNTIIFIYARKQMRPKPLSCSRSFSFHNNSSTSVRLHSENEAVGDHWGANHHGDNINDSDDSSTSTGTQPEAKYVFTGKQEEDEKDHADHSHHTGGSITGHSSNFSVTMTKDQARRLRLVSSQAILFVASYVLCQVWTGVTGLLEDQGDTVEEELTILVKNYPIFVLQAIVSPLQGLFNMIVFIRPKYLKYRHLHKGESRLWVVRRSIFGEEVQPTIRNKHHPRRKRNVVAPGVLAKQQQQQPKQQLVDGDNHPSVPDHLSSEPNGANNNASPSIARRLTKDMVSDLTASQGDFDHVMQDEDDERWQDKDGTTEKSKVAPLASYRKRSSLLLCTSSALDVISENEQSFFEAVPVLPGSEDFMITNTNDLSFSPKSLDRRWSSGSVQLVGGEGANVDKSELLSLALPIPARLESALEPVSTTEEETASISSDHTPETTSEQEETSQERGSPKTETREPSTSLDRPIQIPRRRMSPPPAAPGSTTRID